MEFHYIQEQIIRKLIATEKLAKYSELQIEGVENDLFNYHLQKLVKLKLVDKNNAVYKLSALGLKYTEDIVPLSVFRPEADQFKLYSHGIVIRKNQENIQIMNRERTKQPFYGDKGILGESVRKGQDTKSALSTRLEYQAGIKVDVKDMKLAGVIRKITRDQSGELFSDFIYYIYFCLDYENDLDPKLYNNTVYWTDLEQAIQNEENAQHPFPSLVRILKSFQTNPSLKSYEPIIAEDIVQVNI